MCLISKDAILLFRSLGNAIVDSDYELLKSLLDVQESEASSSDAIGQALQMAITRKDKTAIDILLKAGGNVNYKACGQVPFLQAVEVGDWEIMKLLIDHGANINSARSDGTALHILARKGKVELVEKLIDCGADIDAIAGAQGTTPLCAAAQTNKLDCAELLLKHSVKVNVSDSSWCRTPLHWAAINGNVKLTELLLAHGADTQAVDKFDSTPFMYTITQNQSFVTSILLSKQDVNSELINGKTALHFAAERGSVSCARHLLEAGANPNVTDNYGNTPLMIAAQNKKSRMVKLLVDKTDLTITNNSCLTAFHLSVQTDPFDNATCKALVDADADIDIAFPDGNTCLTEFATDTRRLHWLLSHGANPNIGNKLGHTPLWLACRNGNVQCVQLLLRANANMNVKVKFSEDTDSCTTPVQEALKRRDILTVKSLVTAGCNTSGLGEIIKLVKPYITDSESLDNVQLKDGIEWLENKIKTPKTLEEFARIGLREGLGKLPRKKVEKLPLPNIIKSFVNLADLRDIDHSCFLTL